MAGPLRSSREFKSRAEETPFFNHRRGGDVFHALRSPFLLIFTGRVFARARGGKREKVPGHSASPAGGGGGWEGSPAEVTNPIWPRGVRQQVYYGAGKCQHAVARPHIMPSRRGVGRGAGELRLAPSPFTAPCGRQQLVRVYVYIIYIYVRTCRWIDRYYCVYLYILFIL